ncbi:MAG TPA: hypothetical protein VNX29_04560 [Kaistia sp.]|nr:hypothetical protein [Kaistia sp.]
MPIPFDVSIWRGNDRPDAIWAWPDGYTATTNCQLTIWVRESLVLVAQGGAALIVDTVGRRFIWRRTVAESRLIPEGRVAQYEIEDHRGGEETIFYGTITGLGGLNLDEDEPDGSPGQLDFSTPLNSALELDGWL